MPYDHYRVVSRYSHDAGVRVLPGTGAGRDGGKGLPVTVHGGQTKLYVAWTARRAGVPPVLPAARPSDPNLVYLGGTVMPAQIEIGADGYSPVYEVTGAYSYGVIDPDRVTVTAPVPPFLSGLAAQAGRWRRPTPPTRSCGSSRERAVRTRSRAGHRVPRLTRPAVAAGGGDAGGRGVRVRRRPIGGLNSTGGGAGGLLGGSHTPNP